ncbi:MAG: hypothetical protein HOM93_01610 [Candidatus Marinimicrobia bacterium]|nr:hypothetical protein [Candidatus Neomarinimicrobiota bacterium]
MLFVETTAQNHISLLGEVSPPVLLLSNTCIAYSPHSLMSVPKLPLHQGD